MADINLMKHILTTKKEYFIRRVNSVEPTRLVNLETPLKRRVNIYKYRQPQEVFEKDEPCAAERFSKIVTTLENITEELKGKVGMLEKERLES